MNKELDTLDLNKGYIALVLEATVLVIILTENLILLAYFKY